MVRKEFELQEHEESEVGRTTWDVGSVDDGEGLVCYEHFGHFFVDGWSDCMLVIFH